MAFYGDSCSAKEVEQLFRKLRERLNCNIGLLAALDKDTILGRGGSIPSLQLKEDMGSSRKCETALGKGGQNGAELRGHVHPRAQADGEIKEECRYDCKKKPRTSTCLAQ